MTLRNVIGFGLDPPNAGVDGSGNRHAMIEISFLGPFGKTSLEVPGVETIVKQNRTELE